MKSARKDVQSVLGGGLTLFVMIGALLFVSQAEALSVVAGPITNPATCHQYYVLSPSPSWAASETTRPRNPGW